MRAGEAVGVGQHNGVGPRRLRWIWEEGMDASTGLNISDDEGDEEEAVGSAGLGVDHPSME